MSKKTFSTSVQHKLIHEDITADLIFLDQEENLDELLAQDPVILDEPKSFFQNIPHEFLNKTQEAELSLKIQNTRKKILTKMISTEPGLEYIVEQKKSQNQKGRTSTFFHNVQINNPQKIYSQLQTIWRKYKKQKKTSILFEAEAIVGKLSIKIGQLHELVKYAHSWSQNNTSKLIDFNQRLTNAKYALKELDSNKEALAKPNMLWGFHLMRKYSSFAPKEMLQHATYSGILKAAENYDSTKGRFTTYATAWIISSLQDAVRQHCAPQQTAKEFRCYLKIKKAETHLFQTFKQTPLNKEIAEHIGLTEKQVEQLKTQNVKLRYAVDEAEWSDIEEKTTTCPVEKAHNAELARGIREHLERLNPREQEVIKKLYGIDETPHTLDEIGQQLGLTRERVRQIEAKALPKLHRKDLEKYVLHEE